MSEPPPLPPPLPPQPIDYAKPVSRVGSPRTFSWWMYFGGLASGAVMSVLAWRAYFHASWSDLNWALVGIAGIIAGKLALGAIVEVFAPRRGFLAGLILSIVLVPLVAVGTIAVVCFSGNVRLN